MLDIILEADRNVAISSPDHVCPWGTKHDSSTNPLFNRKLYALYPDPRRVLRVLDLGCSGGGFVRNCLDDGCFAVGLEGSDFSQKNRRAEWRTIPERLFTCDISRPFHLYDASGGTRVPLQFDVITAWEVIEHIAEADLAQVAANVATHLAPGGLWILSVSPIEEVIQGVRLHQTVQPQAWWLQKFEALGFVNRDDFIRYFNTQFVRGPKNGGPGSFNLVLVKRDHGTMPCIPKLSFKEFLFARWVHSRLHRILKTIVLGQVHM